MHILGIILAGLAMFALGAVWFSPVLFVKAWIRESGTDASQKPDAKQMAQTFGFAILLMVVSAVVLDYFITTSTSGEGIIHGLSIGFLGGVLAATTTGINYLFEKKSWTLFFINAGYDMVGFCLMGVILALL